MKLSCLFGVGMGGCLGAQDCNPGPFLISFIYLIGVELLYNVG